MPLFGKLLHQNDFKNDGRNDPADDTTTNDVPPRRTNTLKRRNTPADIQRRHSLETMESNPAIYDSPQRASFEDGDLNRDPSNRRRRGLFGRKKGTYSEDLSDTDSDYQTARSGNLNRTGILGGAGKSRFVEADGASDHIMDPENGEFEVTKRGGHDSLELARMKVKAAVIAEREASRMLIAARNAVAEAHEHVARIEDEAKTDAARAEEKRREARSLRHDTKQLGRI